MLDSLLFLNEETEAHRSKTGCPRRCSYLCSITPASHQRFQKWLYSEHVVWRPSAEDAKWQMRPFVLLSSEAKNISPKIPESHPFGRFWNKNNKPHSRLEVEFGLLPNILVLNVLHNCSLLCTSMYWCQYISS